MQITNVTIPAIYGCLTDIGFNINPIFIKENNDWYLVYSNPKKQSDYDMYIMNENGMCKRLPIEHPYKNENACLIYFESDERQMLFNQKQWLLAEGFQIFSEQHKIWYKLGVGIELENLIKSLIDPLFKKVKEYSRKNIGSNKEYLSWGTLLASCRAPAENIAVYILYAKKFKNQTDEEFIKDSEFWLERLPSKEERDKTLCYLKEFGIELK